MTSFRNFPAALAAITLLLATGCGRTKPESSEAETFVVKEGRILVPETSPLRTKLKVQSAEAKTIEAIFTTPATVEADPADLVKLAPPLPGRIVQIHVRQGDSVKKGQPLITLESAEFAQAQAEFLKAKAQAQQVSKALERVHELHQHDIASQKELEQAESDHVSADSELKRAEARLIQLGVKSGDDISGGLLVLRAPISGKICELAAAHGGFWNDLNAPLLILANLDRVNLTASVQEKDIPRLYVGQEAIASVASFPGEVFRVRVVATGELLDPDTRTTKVRLPLQNRGHRLLPSMFATVNFVIKPHQGILVPTQAVLQDAEGSKVLVEVSPWTFQERLVITGAQVDQQTEVIQGLKAGERIVVQEGVLLHAH